MNTIHELEQKLEIVRNAVAINDFNDNLADHVGMCILEKNPLRNTKKIHRDYKKASEDFRREIIKTVRNYQVKRRKCYDFQQVKELIQFLKKVEEARLLETRKSILITSHQSLEEKMNHWYKSISNYFSKLPAHKKALSVLITLPASILASPLFIRAFAGIFLSSLSEKMLNKFSIKCEKGSCITEMNQFLNELTESKETSKQISKLIEKLEKKIRGKHLEITLEKMKPYICTVFLPCRIIPDAGIILVEILKKI